jgi:hypothetical protein
MFSEGFGNAGLLEDSVRRVSGLYFVIDREFPIGYRAVPDFVVAFSLPVKCAVVGAEDPFDLGGKVRHSDGAQADSLFVLEFGPELDQNLIGGVPAVV